MPCYNGKYTDELISNAASLGCKPFVDVMKEPVVTIEGHDAQRCAQYYSSGSRFARCRSVLKIGPDEPSELVMDEKAEELAQYAVICQQNGLVPIIEPEILVDGPHDIERCERVTENVLATCLTALVLHRVLLKGVVFSINMVTPGSDAKKVSPEEVAHYTLLSLQRTLPAAVQAVVFMSGGQNEEEANLNINAIKQYDGKIPWKLSISFWKSQAVFLRRCKANSDTTLGSTRSVH